MFQGMTGWHLLIVLAVILLLFGAARLPALAKSVGQSARLFKKEIKQLESENRVAAPAPAPDSAAGSLDDSPIRHAADAGRPSTS